ncbi:unnamed protein product [Medioppia subpectinata]|uniref:Glycoside hydrolase family 31 TIM barrel domain-containing protein n=1 Tax=Medioppia subpectinata TaxID=1979941 RepID=A0A7R9KHB7_9ACAR|nr:unnamed protein product [Medioppia subpectinata]CAG2102204.1 unnamed protein product [Medioppia subpectinata]
MAVHIENFLANNDLSQPHVVRGLYDVVVDYDRSVGSRADTTLRGGRPYGDQRVVKRVSVVKTWPRKFIAIVPSDSGDISSFHPEYGSHPFHLNVEDNSTGLSHGVFLHNSNAMDILLQPEPAITWRTIGGILDILVGKPEIPPFWGLGYHQCRCCSEPHTLAAQMVITERTIAAGIPFGTQWNAKEYMKPTFDDFTVDKDRWGGFGDWVRHLHDIGTYPPYDDGVSMDIFIKNHTDGIFVGHTWHTRSKTVWPDFSHPKSVDNWTKQFREFYKQVPIDVSWNDMNEIANGMSSSINGCSKGNSLESPPYVPKQLSKLQHHTLCMTAKHYARVEYNVHNLVLKEVSTKRSFVISRATSPSQGKYSGHWDGDIDTDYLSMQWTIPSIMNMNMFGIPLVGGDICGFLGKAENNTFHQELCARWFEIGAFYSFSRNDRDALPGEMPWIVNVWRRYANNDFMGNFFNIW